MRGNKDRKYFTELSKWEVGQSPVCLQARTTSLCLICPLPFSRNLWGVTAFWISLSAENCLHYIYQIIQTLV